LSGPAVFALDRLVDFPSVNRNFPRRFDAQSDLIASHVYDRYDDVIADDDAFIALSGQNEHVPPGARTNAPVCEARDGACSGLIDR
jgi:hypothetical protein